MEAGATPSLTRLLSHFAQQRSEKHRYRQNIQARWNQAIPAVELERAGENCLYQMEAMAKKWISADEALTLVAHMAITRIQEAKYKQQHNQHSGGRGLTKQLTTKDWTNARSLSSSDAIDILRTSRYTRSDLLECLDANVVEWIQCHLKIRDHTAASHPLSAVHDHTARPREPEVAEEHNRPAVDDIAQTEAYSSSNRDAHQLSNRISEEPEQLGLGLNGRAQDDAGLTDWLKNSNMVMCGGNRSGFYEHDFCKCIT